jgi:vitamin B12 transporter
MPEMMNLFKKLGKFVVFWFDGKKIMKSMNSDHIGSISFVGLVIIQAIFLSNYDVKAEDVIVKDLSPLVVTSHQDEVPQSQIGGAVTIINRESIEAMAQTNIVDALRSTPGVNIVQSGGPGGSVSTFMRGANGEHTLVLIDGVEVNNPATPGGSFDLANITTDGVERIEILRGPQSLMYGSNAIGGVIHIITKKGAKENKLSLTALSGNYETTAGTSTLLLSDENKYLTLSASGSKSQSNISSADQRDGNFERDPYSNSSFSALGGLRVGLSDLEFNLKKVSSEAEIDRAAGVGGDDPNRKLSNDVFVSSVSAHSEFFNDLLDQRLQFEYAEHELTDINEADVTAPLDLIDSRFQGYRTRFSVIEVIKPIDWLKFDVGGEYENESANSQYVSYSQFGEFKDELLPSSTSNGGVFSELLIQPEWLGLLTIGNRYDDHSRFGGQDTWRITASRPVSLFQSRIHSSVGTGFKAPTVTQLFSSFGNSSLQAETSRGWDFGYEFLIPSSKILIDTTYFRNEFRNLIQFDPSSFILQNIDNAETQGVEVSIKAPIFTKFEWLGFFTYLDTEDKSTGSALLRRASRQARSVFSYIATKRLRINLNTQWVGPRRDRNFTVFPAENVSLGSYVLFGLNGSYELGKGVSATLAADNLLDKEYQEVYGFGSPGARVMLGLKIDTNLSISDD